jgi:hypothetical protein
MRAIVTAAAGPADASRRHHSSLFLVGAVVTTFSQRLGTAGCAAALLLGCATLRACVSCS